MTFNALHEEIAYDTFKNGESPVQIQVKYKSNDNEGNITVNSLSVNLSSDDSCYNSQAIAEALKIVQTGMEIERLRKIL